MKNLVVIALSTLTLATACKKNEDSSPAPMQVSATLSPGNELPALTNSSATGTLTGTYNPTSKLLSYTVTFSGLSENATNGHLHYGDTKHQNPMPVVAFTNVPAAKSGTFSGTATLTSQQADSLTMGHMYTNIHTPTHPAGELRANLLAK